MIPLVKGTFVKATKLIGKAGASLALGQTFLGTLQTDVRSDHPLWIDSPGMDWLVTSAVVSVAYMNGVYSVRTANSLYEVRIVPNEVPGMPGTRFV